MPSSLCLEAAAGLRLEQDGDAFRLAFRERDWLGPIALDVLSERAKLAPEPRTTEGDDDLGRYTGAELRWEGPRLPVATSVRAYADLPLLVFRLEAREPIREFATGTFAAPRVAWPAFRPDARAPGGVPEGTRGYGHQYTEFAFPTFSDASLSNFFQFPHRPSVIAPLWLNAPDGRSLMLAPLDGFHEQVIAVPPRPDEAVRGVRCGWHGDLDAAPAGFATELALWAGPGPRAVLASWAGALRRRYGTVRPSRYADASVARLSYWTDNGATYWYRSEPGHSVPETLEAVARDLEERDVPVGAFQLDSWFYPHEVTRPVDPEGQEHVPPTGMLVWEPREDVLPEGVPALRRRLGDPPLITHARHFSSRSPYFEDTAAWLDGDRAHPRDPAFFERLLDQAASWGVATFEQDWLVEMFLGVRGLREEPGRARAWQEAVDRAAADRGMTLQWCMASPADFFQTLHLSRVTSIRTSGDYRYLSDNPALWVRFLYTNALARALGLNPYKDVFLSNAAGTGIDGDPHAEAEALLAALSSGPVGIGDRLGRTDRALLLRTCREDGVLVKPDRPLAAIDRCLRADCHLEPELLVGETDSRHPAGRWVYVAAFNAWRGRERIASEIALAELGEGAPDGPVVAFDWRTGAFERLEAGDALRFSLDYAQWSLRVLCPLLPGEVALAGDVSRYASMGDRRVRAARVRDGALELDALGRPGERVELRGWSARPLTAGERWSPREGAAALEISGSADGAWGAAVPIGPAGWCRVRVPLP